jgi:hypothetical protein
LLAKTGQSLHAKHPLGPQARVEVHQALVRAVHLGDLQTGARKRPAHALHIHWIGFQGIGDEPLRAEETRSAHPPGGLEIDLAPVGWQQSCYT